MALFLAPVAAAGIGAGYFAILSKTYSLSANLSAKQAFGIEDAYPWPFWRPWIHKDVASNSTISGNIAALVLAGVTFGVQKRMLWKHVGNNLRVPIAEQSAKITTSTQFLKIVGPGIIENSANALVTCGLVGFAKPWLDGCNNLPSPKC